MDKHTPGPWVVDINHATGNPEFIRTFISSSDGGDMYDIANVWCDETGNAKANARLIAAAPDLLAALQIAENALDMYSGGQSSDLAAIRIAIDKATGAE